MDQKFTEAVKSYHAEGSVQDYLTERTYQLKEGAADLIWLNHHMKGRRPIICVNGYFIPVHAVYIRNAVSAQKISTIEALISEEQIYMNIL